MHNPGMLLAMFCSMRRRFSGRADSEHEQAFVRLAIGILLFFYFFHFSRSDNSGESGWNENFAWVMGMFIIISISLIIHIAVYPQISPARRLLAAALDSGTITFFFFNADEFAIPLYFLYLWVIFGHGFRFGLRYLFFTLALSLLGFGAVVLKIPYWQQNRFLGAGLWFGMFFVSMYVSTLVKRLTAALEHAEAANQAKRRFISSVSHELRTPLNAIIGMADLLRSTRMTAEQTDMVHSLDNASHVMLSLIEDVLDFSKIEAGKLVMENIPFDLHELIRSTTDIFKYQAAQSDLQLITYSDPSVPYRLHGDPHHLRQVLANLLSNAIKFTKKGKVTLRIEASIETSHSVKLRFEVEDTGIGIAPEAQAKVFDSFTQAHESTARRYGGTGLGTTISKQLVELMGGHLGLHSQLGAGSTFWFELELEKQSAEEGPPSFPGMRALLVGFSAAELRPMATLMEECGVEYDTVPDLPGSSTALQNAKLIGGQYGLAGGQYGLALINGMVVQQVRSVEQSPAFFLEQLVKELQAVPGKTIPVILCGAHGLGEKSNRQIAEESGLTAVLDFPIEKKLFWNAMHAAAATLSAMQKNSPEHIKHSAYDKIPDDRYSVLVAEDNATNRAVIEKILGRAGYRCILVKNGEEALDVAAREDFDVLILDMNMPVMNGLEAVKAYRFMYPEKSRKPVIMFSANVTTEVKKECLEAGVDEFLPKPIQVAPFLETLGRLVKNSGALPKTPPAPRNVPPVPLLAQPTGDQVVLNYAALAELESIGQGSDFVDALIEGFIEDTQQLIERLHLSLLDSQVEESREILHALAGSAISIGASSLRMTCHRFERMGRAELTRDTSLVIDTIRRAFEALRESLDQYRRQRFETTMPRQ